ncbi:MAG: Mu-like prophage major head subunit gpT family protein [Burkholderiaceae bacterium]|nr:Mu-like prophage major head subunit gpT family protein [Burkholderiaceae bacterium]
MPNAAVETLQMPMMTRLAPVTDVDVAARTVNLVWTTGAGVRRYDWYNDRYYMEELSMDPKHVRMERLQSGRAPLLNTHGRYDLSDVMGVIPSAELSDGQGTASARFSKREDVEPYYQDVVDKIICNVSVGYNVYEMDRIPPSADGQPWRYVAIDWEPFEISLVPVGADADCGVRSDDPVVRAKGPSGPMKPCKFSTRNAPVLTTNPAAAGQSTRKEITMPGEENNTTTTAATVAVVTAAPGQRDLDAARAEGARAEADRQAGIREMVTLGGLEPAFADQLIAQREMTAADAGAAVLREQAKRSAAVNTRSAANIQTVSDETDVRRAAMADAIVLRANPNPDFRNDASRMGAARQFRGLTLLDMARESIEAAGGNTRGMSRREVAVMAMNLQRDLQVRGGMHSTSDFPEILASTVGRTLRTAYQLQPRTFTGWARESTAPDFRQVARVQLSESSAMREVKEGGEYKSMTFGDSAEKYSLGKYGGIIAITWESVVNDDLSAFDRIPMSLAAEAAALEGDIVYGILTANAAMSDSVALFHANHGNLLTAAAITDVSLGLGRAAMRKQTGLKGRVLNLTPSFLIVGPDKESEANKYTSSNFVAAKSIDINPAYNTSLEVVVDPRIPGDDWFLSAAPGIVDTVEFSYLEGEQGLYTETRQGFEVDGLQVKARHVFAAKAIDWRGMQKNPGA